MINKTITLAITCCNEKSTIKRAVDSATTSKYITEILISDDWSTDGSFELLNSLARNNSRINLIRNSGKPYSLRYNRLNLIYNIESDYVMFLDGDDYIECIDEVIEKCFKLGEWDICYYPIKIGDDVLSMGVGYLDSKSNEELSHLCNHYICKTTALKGVNGDIVYNDYISDDQITLYILNHCKLVGTLCDSDCYYMYNDGGKLRHFRKFGLKK